MKYSRYTVIIYAFLVLCMISWSTLNAVSGQSNDYFAGVQPTNRPFEEIGREYWQWWITVKSNETDMTINPDKCIKGYDEEKRIVFLINSYELEYNSICTITSENYILVPLLIGECDPTLEEYNYTYPGIEELKRCLDRTNDNLAAWKVSLDNEILLKQEGSEKVNLELMNQYFIKNSSEFMLTIQADNRYNVIAGSYPAVIGGYYIILNPLPLGKHTLEYSILHKPQGLDLKPVITGKVKYIFDVREQVH